MVLSLIEFGCAGDGRVYAQQDLSTIDGRFLSLTTDLASAEERRTIVESFDAAVPQWIRFLESF